MNNGCSVFKKYKGCDSLPIKDLSGQYFSNCSFSSIKFENYNLDNTKFIDCDFDAGCSFSGLEATALCMIRCTHKSSIMDSIVLNGSSLMYRCEFFDCDMYDSLHIGTSFDSCIFYDSNISNVNFIKGCKFNNVGMYDCYMSGSVIINSSGIIYCERTDVDNVIINNDHMQISCVEYELHKLVA